MPTAPRARSTRRHAPAAAPAKGRSNATPTARRRKAAATPPQPPTAATGFPGWSDLGVKGRKQQATKKVLAQKARRAHFLDVAPSLRFGVWVLVGCVAATLYVGHVFATQET